MASKRSTRAVAGLALTLIVAVVASTVVGNVAADAAPGQGESASGYVGHVGMNSNGFWFGPDDATDAYSRLADAGVTQVREDFNWNATEPQQGNFDWSHGDSLMTASSRTGVEVLGILDYSASWASSDPSGGQQYAPRNNAEYAAFARAVVRRYSAGGTFWSQHPELNPQPLTAVEIWNEPWGWWSWRSGPNPGAYAGMARAAAEAVHAANPAVKVVMEATLLQVRQDGASAGWIDRVLAAQPTLKDLVDVFSIHPYPYPFNNGPKVDHADPHWDYQQVALVRQTTVALGARKPIWITEVGWSTAPSADGGVTESQQSTYIHDAIVRAFTDWPYVERVYLYSDDSDGSNRSDLQAWFGLFHSNGSPKPAWNNLVHLMQTSAPVPPTTTPPTTRAPTTTPPRTTPSTTTPPTTTPPRTTPTTTPPTNRRPVLMPAKVAVRVSGVVIYYDPGL